MNKPPRTGTDQTAPDPSDALDVPSSPDVPEEVTKANLERYLIANLEGRLAHYEREALLERNPTLRTAYRNEVTRTKAEIARRRAPQVAAANRVFKHRPFKTW